MRYNFHIREKFLTSGLKDSFAQAKISVKFTTDYILVHECLLVYFLKPLYHISFAACTEIPDIESSLNILPHTTDKW